MYADACVCVCISLYMNLTIYLLYHELIRFLKVYTIISKGKKIQFTLCLEYV